MKPTPTMPTNAELVILRVLWDKGPSTVLAVHQDVYSGTGVGYTSALKLLQNMREKGLVTRQEDSKQHVYAAAIPERRTMNALVRGWIENSFAGSSAALVMRALEAKPMKREELSKLKALLAELEEKNTKP